MQFNHGNPGRADRIMKRAEAAENHGAATSAALFALGGALPLAAGSAFRLPAMPLGTSLPAWN